MRTASGTAAACPHPGGRRPLPLPPGIRCAALPLALLLPPAAPALAQIYTIDAGVSSPELPSLGRHAEWWKRADGEELRYSTGLTWSPHTRLETTAIVTGLYRRGRFTSNGNTISSEQLGFGDTLLLGKWALLREDDVMYSDRVSLLGGLSLPTGESGERSGGELIPRREQLGLGSFGGSLGLGTTVIRDRHRFAAALQWWHFGAHDGFEPGEELRLDAAWWYRLQPARFHPDGNVMEWRVVAELLSKWRTDDRLGGADQRNGGFDLSAVLGLQCHASAALRVETAVQLPITTGIETAFGDPRFGVSFNMRLFF